MTIPDIDIYQSAQTFIDQHGKAAQKRAKEKEEALLSTGNTIDALIWNKIAETIDWIYPHSHRTGTDN